VPLKPPSSSLPTLPPAEPVAAAPRHGAGPETKAAPDAGILAEITSGLSAGSDLQELLARFMPPLVALAHADGGAVRVLDDDGRRMLLVASQGLPEDVQRAEGTVHGACGVCSRATQGDVPVWADDLGECGRRNPGGFFGGECQRLLAVPLTHRGRTLGVCNLFYGEGAEPPPGSLQLLASVGALLGLALAHARLERENLRASLLQERQAIAADVHDSIGQSLAFVKMRLPLLHDAMQAGDAREAGRYFEDVRQAVGQAHASLRGILSEFRTRPDPLGLAHALAVSAAAFREQSGAQLELLDELPPGLLSPAQQHQVAQVVQEALLNVARHAGARHAWVRLRTVPGPAVEVLVMDDGVGVQKGPAGAVDAAGAAGTAGAHYGLAIMRERAQRLAGTLTLQAREGGGTCVRLLFALAGATAPPAETELH